jgi:hypothetical protein
MHNQFKIYCFVAYTPLNMFRALLCPSSGAFAATGYRIIAGLDVLRAAAGLQTDRSLKHVQPGSHTVTSGCKGSWRGAPVDGHNSARNMLSGVYATKQ